MFQNFYFYIFGNYYKQENKLTKKKTCSQTLFMHISSSMLLGGSTV